MTEITVPSVGTTPADLANRLTMQLANEQRPLRRLDNYYRADTPLSFLRPEVAAMVNDRIRSLTINWPRVVVSSVEERLDVEGFRRVGEDAADEELWRVWQANGMDEESQIAHLDALIFGRSFALVWADPADDSTPRVTVESPLQMTALFEPGSTRVAAAWKQWVDPVTLVAFGTLYLPNSIVKYKAGGSVLEPMTPDLPLLAPGVYAWKKIDTLKNPLGVVPVVPLVNARRLLYPYGESELTDVIPLSDAVNKLATDMMVTAEFHATGRRWATGIELDDADDGDDTDRDDGRPAPAGFRERIGALWVAESEGARFGQFPEADLSNFIRGIAMLTEQIAALAGLPPHYLGIHGDQPASADAIRSSEAALVARARRKARQFGGAWEMVARLIEAVQVGGAYDEAAARKIPIETIWRDPETRTVAQQADAAVKLVTASIIPAEQAQEDLGYTPTQRERMREMARGAALDAAGTDLMSLALTAPAPPATSPAPNEPAPLPAPVPRPPAVPPQRLAGAA